MADDTTAPPSSPPATQQSQASRHPTQRRPPPRKPPPPAEVTPTEQAIAEAIEAVEDGAKPNLTVVPDPPEEQVPQGSKDDLAAALPPTPAARAPAAQTAARPVLRTRKLSEVEDKINVLYCGDPGTGKTTHLATMAFLGKVMYLNLEGGLKRKPLESFGIPVGNIEVVELEHHRMHDQLTEVHLVMATDLREDPNSWAGIVIDSMSEGHSRTIQDVKLIGLDRAQRKGADRDWWFIDRSDYGAASEISRHHLRQLRDLPCHFGVSTLLRREVDNDGVVTYNPGVTPGLQGDLLGMPDVVCYTSVGEVGVDDEFRGLFRPIGKMRGKDRFRILPARLVDPTFQRIHAYINGSLTLDKDEVMKAAHRRRQEAAQEAVAVTSGATTGGAKEDAPADA